MFQFLYPTIVTLIFSALITIASYSLIYVLILSYTLASIILLTLKYLIIALLLKFIFIIFVFNSANKWISDLSAKGLLCVNAEILQLFRDLISLMHEIVFQELFSIVSFNQHLLYVICFITICPDQIVTLCCSFLLLLLLSLCCVFETFYTFYNRVVIRVSYLRMLWLFLATFLKTYQTAIKIHSLAVSSLVINSYISYNHLIMLGCRLSTWAVIYCSGDTTQAAQLVHEQFPEVAMNTVEELMNPEGIPTNRFKPTTGEITVVLGAAFASFAYIVYMLLSSR